MIIKDRITLLAAR